MPNSVTVTPRKIFIEDLQLSTIAAPVTLAQSVGGVGIVPLTEVDMVRYSAYGSYASDSAAATGGVGIGFLYFHTGTSLLKVRMS